MQRQWSADELGKRWSLLPEDLALLAGRVDAGKLGFAVQLAFWRQHGRFPNEEADVAPAVVAHLATQIGVGTEALDGYAWAGRSGRRHRVAIIDHLAVAAFDEAAEARFRRWLADDVLPREFTPAALDEELSLWFARSRVTRPGAYRLDRILRSAQASHDNASLQRVADRLDGRMRERLGALLADDGDGTAYARLAADPGRVGLESLLAEIARLERLRALALPPALLRGLHPDQAKRFRRRAAVESAWELRRHPERIRLPLLAFWCAPRQADVVDGLIDQNLVTEWHVRYGGGGVMIYWHVERRSVCIHSRLRRCSSSEVAAMIEGVLRHDTEMEVERQYVNSHGQSEVAFAFTKLLEFQLPLRLKAISAQRLYLPEAGASRPIPTWPASWRGRSTGRWSSNNTINACATRPPWPSAPPTQRQSCAALSAATSSTRPTRRWPSWARRSRRCSCAATSATRRCGARSTRG